MSGGTPKPVTDLESPDAEDPRDGGTVGSYRLRRLIGRGATGRVFEVEHLAIGRRAAMKILTAESASRPGAIKRLFSEAQAVNKIHNPHIVEVTDLVEAEGPNGVSAIVMELLEGKSLGQAMEDGALPPQRFIPILAQVADALAAAHHARFVHRDLKPDNIFLTTSSGQEDYVKLLDFGLAKSVKDTLEAIAITKAGAASHLTAEGTFVGTPAYASPEQVSGKNVDNRTDIYSLGVILYELLCGRLPFRGRNFGEYVVMHLTQEPPAAPPDVMASRLGRALFATARRCLAKNPADRFESAAELKEIFNRLGRGDDVTGLSPGMITMASAALRGQPRRLVVAGLAVAGAGAAWMLLRPQPTPALQPEAPLAPAAPTARGPSVVPLPDKPVFLRFGSEPPGAETRRVGHPDLLGFTPFRHTMSADGSQVEFEMRLPGYGPRRFRVVLSPEPPVQEVGGALRKLASAPTRPLRRRVAQAPGRGKSQTPDKASPESTLNPFSR